MVYVIIRESRNGRTWYQSRNVGEITRLLGQIWKTANKDAAIQLAAEVGGYVVTL